MMKKLLVGILAVILGVGFLIGACGAPSGPSQPAEQASGPEDRPGMNPAPAWQQKWESTLGEAKKEGRIVIYGQVGPELREALTAAFKKELGLDLELVAGKGSEVATRFITETQAGIYSADILLGGASTFLTDPKMVAAWDKMEPLLILPEVLDGKAWPGGSLPFVDSQKRLIPLVLQSNQLLLINTDVVKPGQIRAYRDLLQPQWKGKIVMYDPTIGGTANSWVTLILTRAYGPVEGEEFLRKYVTQEPMITKDSRLQIEWLARGRYPVNVAVDSQAAYSMHKNGAPITRLAAEEGGLLTGGGGYLGLPLKRPHPQAATVVLNWLLSARGQEIYSQGYGAPAARLGISAEAVSPLALPLPGEKVYQQDEEFVLAQGRSPEVAKKIFAPLMK